MTTLSSFAPVSGIGSSDDQQHDATQQEPRFDSSSVFQAGDYLEQQAERLESGIPIDQHEAEIREIEAIAEGGGPRPDEVETMEAEPAKLASPDDPRFEEMRADFIRELVSRVTDSVPEPGKIFRGAVIEVCVLGVRGTRFVPDGPKSNLEVEASAIPSFHAAREVAIAMNRVSIKRGKLSCAVVVRQRPSSRSGQKYAVLKVPTGIPVKNRNPIQDHPAIRFETLDFSQALEESERLNIAVKKKNGNFKRWHVVVVPIAAEK